MDVKNTTSAPVDWTTSFTFEEGTTLGGPWNVLFTVSGNTVNVEGNSNNNVINPDVTLTFGFCVTRPQQP